MANMKTEKPLPPKVCQDLIEAVKKGNVSLVKNCIQEYPEVIYKSLDKQDSKLLHFVAFYNRTEMAEYLLQHGADVHARNVNGFVPLHFSCEKGHLETTRILIKYNADVNIVTIEKSTPLHEAVKKDHLIICDLLLKHNADPNIKNIFGRTPVDLAEDNSCDNILDKLRNETRVEMNKKTYECGSDIETIIDTGHSHIQCQPCSAQFKSAIATMFCETCNEYQCQNCLHGHMINSQRPHILVSSDVARNKSKVVDLKGLDQCADHKKSLKFFCQDENQIGCSTCFIIRHRNCKGVMEIAAEEFQAGEVIKKCLKEKEKLVELMEKNSSTTSYLQTAVKDIEKQKEDIAKDLDSMRTRIIQHFDQFAANIVQQLNTIKNNKVQELETIISKCTSLQESLTSENVFVNNVMAHGTYVQKFIIQHCLQKCLPDYLNTALELESNIVTTNMMLMFEDTLTSLANSTTELGSLMVLEGKPKNIITDLKGCSQDIPYLDSEDISITYQSSSQKSETSAVNCTKTTFFSENGNIDETMKDNFKGVDIDFDQNCKSFVSGSFDAILDPDINIKIKTDENPKVLDKGYIDSVAAVASNVQTKQELQVGANKSSPMDHSNFIQMPADKKQIEEVAEKSFSNRNMKEPMKDHNPCIQKPADKKQIEGVAEKSFSNRNMKEPIKDHNPSIQTPADKKQIEGVAGTSLSHKQIKEPMACKQLQVKVVNENIIKCSVDCLIISCNQTLSTKQGIMAAVAASAGNAFTKACQTEANQYELAIAECRPVTSGALKCKKIILVRGPQIMSDKKQMFWDLQNAYSNALKKADELGYHSVAVHAIEQDLWKTNMEDCAKQFKSAVDSIKYTLRNLDFVYFVENQKKFYEMIRSSLINQAGVEIDIDGRENCTSTIAKSFPCQVEAKVAKVEDLIVDAAVSTESQRFTRYGQIASNFFQLGNEEYRRARSDLCGRTCKVTDVLYTKVTGGMIKCKFVLHAIVPSRYQKYTSNTKDIRLTVGNILEQASGLHCISVAIPLLGINDTDNTSSVTSCCQAMIQGIKEFFLSAKPVSVKHIVFCSVNTAFVKIFQDILTSKT